jgi:mannose-6-phosphate isomerase
MEEICILKNPVQKYEWGSRTEIQTLLGRPVPGTKPMAELWMGAHPKAPSQVSLDGKWKSLIEVIRTDPVSILGKNVAQAFSNNLPFLFKIVAVDRPLSLQVHPDQRQAKEGFKRENDLGVPMEAQNRNYKDENHKPELVYALTPFQCLKGFRKADEVLKLMEKVLAQDLFSELRILRQEPNSKGVERFFNALLNMETMRQKDITARAKRIAEGLDSYDPAFQWVARLHREYNSDIGVLSPLFLNLVDLDPGEAIYTAAGELHTYLIGSGIELMANSDNVIRGGLTSKHKDIPELLRIVNYESGSIHKIRPELRGKCGKVYPTPVKEFLLSVISVNKKASYVSPKGRSAEIMICLNGKAEIRDDQTGDSVSLNKGRSVLVPAAVDQYSIRGNAEIYKASVPK